MVAGVAHAGLLGVALPTLVSAGQPLFAEDTWLHLALGRAYTENGPWLAADPLLHTAAGPPAPAAWLFDAAIHGLAQLVGFQGLRIAHAAAVAGILALAWLRLSRASGSPAFASLGTGVFAALSAYRLFQLRPELFTITATLLLLGWLSAGAPPSRRRLAAIAALFAVWVNVHAGFVLGLVLVGAAAAAGAAAGIADPAQRGRAERLAVAFGAALAATLANPSLAEPHLLYFRAGAATPALEMVQDEWARLLPWRLPVAGSPPSPLAWAIVWGLLLATPIAAARRLRTSRSEAVPVALAAIALIGIVSAVRLTWLGIAPLLLVGRLGAGAAHRAAPALAAAAVALPPAFLLAGDWPMISRGIYADLYAQPYAVGKYDSHAVWFLRDAGVEGRLYNDYASANFLGYWLAPRLTAFLNGSLNVPIAAMEAWLAIGRRSGVGGERFGELLDRYGVDVFFGTGLPVVPSARIPSATTRHLEREAGWIPVFRSPRSAVYLRRNGRNAANLARIADWYRRARVPFDPEVGVDPARAIERAPRWAVEQGIASIGHRELEVAASSFDPSLREPARDRLAELYALLGSYERAATIDRLPRSDAAEAAPLGRAQRRVWTLLQLRRGDEALRAAQDLAAASAAGDALSGRLIEAARLHAELPEDGKAALVALLPLLHPPDAARIMAGFVSAETRRD